MSSPRRCTPSPIAATRSLTLRPDYTAGICRAFMSNGELDPAASAEGLRRWPDVSLRAAAEGRQRQFHQIDLEVLGAPEAGARYRGDLGRRRHPRPAGDPRSLRPQDQFTGDPEAVRATARCWSTTIRAISRSFSEDRKGACSAIRCASPWTQQDPRRHGDPAPTRPSPIILNQGGHGKISLSQFRDRLSAAGGTRSKIQSRAHELRSTSPAHTFKDSWPPIPKLILALNPATSLFVFFFFWRRLVAKLKRGPATTSISIQASTRLSFLSSQCPPATTPGSTSFFYYCRNQ